MAGPLHRAVMVSALTGEGMQCPLAGQLPQGIELDRMSCMDWVHTSCLFLTRPWPGQLYPARKGRRVGCMHPTPQCCSRRRAPSSWSEFCASGKPAVHPPGASSTGRADLVPALQETTDAEGSGQDTPCEDRGPMCGMTGLEETHPEQGGWGPVFLPAPTPASPSVEAETSL